MVRGFWEKLKKPFFVLAPMADVTDCAFREIIAKYSRHGEEGGGPDVFWTEFVSCDGLVSPGREVLLHDLRFSEIERPIVAQLFTSNPETMFKAAQLVESLGFDGIDINMGCPDRAIEKQGAGAALIRTPEIAKAVIKAAQAGAPTLPVSVKTRLGYNKVEYEPWLTEILSTGIPALTVHLRTRKELSLVPAKWELMSDIVAFVRAKTGTPENGGTLVIGNGDVTDIEDARTKAETTGCDGVMLGRAIFGNPWLFDSHIRKEDISIEQKLRILVEHTKMFEEKLGAVKNFAIMKKHYKAYVNGFDGAKELRMRLMEQENASGVEGEVGMFLSSQVS